MSELLTAKDVEVKAFKKVKFGGYYIPDVEDFLNQVADDIEAYTMQLDEKEARIRELEAFVKKQEAMTDAIKDALIQARKAAKDMEEQAKVNTEKIIAEAKAEAAQYIKDAEGSVQARISEADKKAAEVLAQAQNKASELVHSKENIEQELESSRQQARNEADEILNHARAEAKRLMTDAEREVENYENQIKFLSLQKQQFVKNTVSLLFDFGRIMDKAQQEIDDEMGAIPNDLENNGGSETSAGA